MRRFVRPTTGEEITPSQPCTPNPCNHCLRCLLRNPELHGTLRLVLHDDCPCGHSITGHEIAQSQCHEIARSQFALYRHAKERRLPDPNAALQPGPHGPGLFQAQRPTTCDRPSDVSCLSIFAYYAKMHRVGHANAIATSSRCFSTWRLYLLWLAWSVTGRLERRRYWRRSVDTM